MFSQLITTVQAHRTILRLVCYLLYTLFYLDLVQRKEILDEYRTWLSIKHFTPIPLFPPFSLLSNPGKWEDWTILWIRTLAEVQSEKGTPMTTQPVSEQGPEPRCWDSTAHAPYTFLPFNPGSPAPSGIAEMPGARGTVGFHSSLHFYALYLLKSCLWFHVKSLRTANVTDDEAKHKCPGAPLFLCTLCGRTCKTLESGFRSGLKWLYLPGTMHFQRLHQRT